MPDLKKMLTLEALSEALPSWLKRSTKPEYNADEIDSTLTTNQFVTASDKDNWNAKGTYSKPSGGIPKSDLSSIVQTSLEKADSALQSETDPTVPSWAKQTNKPSYTQDEVADGSTYKRVTQTEKNTWNGKQNALTTTQMQAVNSGITSEKVTQISTNQTNILYVAENGVKNVFPVASGTTSHSDGTLFDKIALHLIAGSWDFSWTSTATPTTGAVVAYDSNKTEITRISVPSGSTSFSGTLNLSQDAYYVTLYVGIDTTVSNIMCKPSWMSSDYQSFSADNQLLTAAAQELVNNGAKNYATINSGSYTATAGDRYAQIPLEPITGGIVVDFGTLSTSQTRTSTCAVVLANSSGTNLVTFNLTPGSKVRYELTLSDTVTLLKLYPASEWGTTAAGDTVTWSNLMITTKSQFGISPAYEPHALGNQFLTPALIEQVDGGAKQLIPYDLSILKSNNTLGSWSNNVYTYNSVTFTVNSDDSISVNRSATGTTGVSFRLATNAAFSPGTYVLSAGSGTLPQNWTLSIDWSDNTHTYATSGTNPTTFTLTAAKTGNIYIWVSTPSGSFTYKPMICTLADWKVSQKYVPYRMPYSQALTLLNQKAPSGIADYVASGSADNLPSGCALCNPNVTGMPALSGNYFIIRTRIYDANCAEQEAVAPAGNRRFNRTKWGGTWTSWAEYTKS